MKVESITKNGGAVIHVIGKYTGTVTNEADLVNVPSAAVGI